MHTTSDHGKRPSQIVGKAARAASFGPPDKTSEADRAIETALNDDIVNQEKLTRIAEQVWVGVPTERHISFDAEDWRGEIFNRCAAALKRAEEKLGANRTDEKLFIAKVKILRQAFAQQVHRAMQTVSKKYEVVRG